MKKLFLMMVALGVMLMLAPAVMIAGGDNNRGETGQGSTNEYGCDLQPCFADAPKPGASIYEAAALTSALDDKEIQHLLFIREEEKLARDIYIVLHEKWGTSVFANIAVSEQRHMDAVADLLDFYGIPDPVVDDTVGKFSDTDIADLYTQLKQWGEQSEADALLVGGYIEEYDILDIWLAFDETDEARIQRVYQNLYEGSYNHLDAFVYNYERLTGEAYVQQILSDEEYQYVMSFVTQAKQAQAPRQQKGR